jgi:hypothetical protein
VYISIPFANVGTMLDTEHAAKLTGGPTAEEMRGIVEEDRKYLSIEFFSPGCAWTIREILDIRENLKAIDTWWLWVVLEGDTEAFILWAPNNTWSSYLCRFEDTVEWLSDW